MKQAEGFTLIEILIALLIIAVVGVSIEQRMGQFYDERSLVADHYQAHWVAWDQMMMHYQIVSGWRKRGAKVPERGNSQQFGRNWYFDHQQQSTVTEALFRHEVQVAKTAFGVDQQPQSQAKLVMYLVH